MLPYYLEQYPQISRAVTGLSRLIGQIPTSSQMAKYPTGKFELEARLGMYEPSTGRFVPGVSRAFFEQTLRLFEQFQAWHEVTDWVECVDYYYEIPGGGSGSGYPTRTARTSVFVSSGGGNITQTHICKQPHGTLTFQTESRSRKLYDIRTALNFEEVLVESTLPTRIEPNMVRIKSRKSFLYGRNRDSEPLWSYDMSKVWCAGTKSRAEEDQLKDQNTVYDIELELLNPEKYMQVTKQDEMFAASSLLLKMVRVFDLDENQFSLTPVGEGR